MATLRKQIRTLVHSKTFERFTFIVILLNSILIGIDLESEVQYINSIQDMILIFFIFEITLRFIGRESNKEYLKEGWNYFDVFIVSISLIPPVLMSGAELSILRVLRILRIFRLLRTIEELRLITSVFFKSIRSLGYSGMLFLTFMYVYAVIGVSLFKRSNFQTPPEWTANPQWLDPYGSIGEAMFSLFRIITGEDWTDLRYNLLQLSPNMNTTVTAFHVSWMIISGFLLINLVVGAVINNYERTMEEFRAKKQKK